jgi:hypothetical protein
MVETWFIVDPGLYVGEYIVGEAEDIIFPFVE